MRSEQAASAAIPPRCGAGIEAALCYSLGARSMWIVPRRQVRSAGARVSGQPGPVGGGAYVSNSTCTAAPCGTRSDDAGAEDPPPSLGCTAPDERGEDMVPVEIVDLIDRF